MPADLPTAGPSFITRVCWHLVVTAAMRNTVLDPGFDTCGHHKRQWLLVQQDRLAHVEYFLHPISLLCRFIGMRHRLWPSPRSRSRVFSFSFSSRSRSRSSSISSFSRGLFSTSFSRSLTDGFRVSRPVSSPSSGSL